MPISAKQIADIHDAAALEIPIGLAGAEGGQQTERIGDVDMTIAIRVARAGARVVEGVAAERGACHFAMGKGKQTRRRCACLPEVTVRE